MKVTTKFHLYIACTQVSVPTEEEKDVEAIEIYKYLKEHYSQQYDPKVLVEFTTRRRAFPFIRSLHSLKQELEAGFFGGIKIALVMQKMVESGIFENPVPPLYMISTKFLDDAGVIRKYLDHNTSAEEICKLTRQAAADAAVYADIY